MERLIDRTNGFPIYVGKQNPYEVGLTTGELATTPEANYSAKSIITEVFNALADYQDTGLTPEQITAIRQKIIQIENRLGESLLKSRTKNEYAESDVINNMLDVIYEIRSAYEK